MTGVEDFAALLRGLGFTLTEEAEFYGNALALGGADISLWELANAYRALANGGGFQPARIWPETPEAGRGQAGPRLSPATAFIVAHILSDRNARSLTFGYENPLATSFWSAVKTGTSKDMRDNWCVGFSRRYTVAVWVGNMQGLPMREVSGISGAAPVWQAVMSYLEGGRGQSDAPEPPSGVVAQAVHFEGLAEPARQEWFRAGSEQPLIRYEPDAVPGILYPVEGAILALDPDIPPERQRVGLRLRTGGERLQLWLNDQRLGEAAPLRSWEPRRGRHRLELRDAAGRTVAAVRFEVRGVGPAAYRHCRPDCRTERPEGG
jgi:penicillin-binding protein 1C